MEKSWDACKEVPVKFKEGFERNRYEGQSKAKQRMDDLPLLKTLRIVLPASSDQFSFSAASLVEDSFDKKEVLK